MNEYGEIPAGKAELKKLLYPFDPLYPGKFKSKFRWSLKSLQKNFLGVLDFWGIWLTVIDRLGAPGDALITANVIRCIKNRFPNIKINCITPHPDLVKYDPNINAFNSKETFFSTDSSYWELIVQKERNINVVDHSLRKLGIEKYEYKNKFFLSKEERAWGKALLDDISKPILAICTKSKEPVKNWPTENWERLIYKLSDQFSIIHLGDNNEPIFDQVDRYAGKLSMRESAATLASTNFFIGPDSLLMHVANGLNIKSIIIFGGSRPVECFGYENNTNIVSKPDCSPCWIHEGYNRCNYNYECMQSISVEAVISKIFN